MCGIAGLYHLKGAPIETDSLARMIAMMHHRGPDQEGIWFSGSLGLAHQRLSIIDLSPRGRNPMPNEDESVWLICNGEIYNYRELRAGLIAGGHRFRSDTDTEVIIHLYEEKGIECVLDLNGMFAFALWDVRKKQLYLARDRFGVKPLYYTFVGDVFAFASEVKAFLALPHFSVQADPLALAEHFTFQNTFGDRTFFKGVHLLQAGHYVKLEGSQLSEREYWDLRFETPHRLSFEACAENLLEVFKRAVHRQLVSDVPLGSFLSGGMDTGAIAAVASPRISGMHTFTCGFELDDSMSALEKYFDETRESHALSRLLGTQHHEFKLGPHAMAPVFPWVVWHLDEPRVGISYQVYYTAQSISRYVKVVLSGVGGDELFAGYPWRYESFMDSGTEDFENQFYQASIRFLNDDEKKKFFIGQIGQSLGDFSTREAVCQILRRAQTSDRLHQAMYFDFKTFLNGLLMVDDKLSMAHSLETRVPFLDNELVDFAVRIPSDFKWQKGEGKKVLRAAFKSLLPDDILHRRKQGFTPPAESWYRGPNRAFVEDLILGKRACARGYFEPSYLRQILDEHVENKRNHRFLIWSLMSFEWWNRLFVDRDSLPQVIEENIKAAAR